MGELEFDIVFLIAAISLGQMSQSAVEAAFSLDLNSIPEASWSYPPCKPPSAGVGGVGGSCVFWLSCYHSGGEHLGICRNGFLFGTCCRLKRHLKPPKPPRPPTEAALAGDSEGDKIVHQQCGRRGGSYSRQDLLDDPRLSRIVGGEESTPGSWPWQAQLVRPVGEGRPPRHRCGAVLVSPSLVATAAHCVDGYTAEEILVVLGEHHRSDEEGREVLVRPERIEVHPLFDYFTYENDLAVVTLKEEVEFTSAIGPICLPEAGRMTVRDVGFVTGWGTAVQGGSKSQVLREVKVTVVGHDRCNELFLSAGSDEELTDVFICAGDEEEGGRDACDGDSGGPLVIKTNGRWTLAGLVSWGDGCGEVGKLGVYTNVAKFVPWIRKRMEEEERRKKKERRRP